MGQDLACGGDCDSGVVGYDFPGRREVMSLCAGSRRWGAELRVADGYYAIETACGRPGPCCGWTRGSGFEMGQYGKEGGVVVACIMVNGVVIGWEVFGTMLRGSTCKSELGKN